MLSLNAKTDLALVFVFFFLFGLLGNSWLSETDLLWHIKTGEWIWQFAAFPDHDIFSHTMAGQRWIAKEWLSQVVFYLIFSYYGWLGLVVFSSAIVSLAISIVYFHFSFRRNVPAIIVLLGCVLIFVPLAKIVRPQIFMFPLMALLLVMLDRSLSDERRPTFLIFPLTVLWANLHASFPLIFLFFGFAALEVMWRSRRTEWRSKMIEMILLAFLIVLAMGVTPYGFGSLSYAISFVNSDINQVINEWYSYVTLMARFGPSDYIFYLAVPLAIAMWGFYVVISERAAWPRLFAMIVLLVSAIQHFRFLQIFSFYTMFACLASTRRLIEKFDIQKLTRKSERFYRISLLGFSIVFLGGAIFTTSRAPFNHLYPTRALAAAQSYGVKGHVINSYDFGGFLIFNGIETFVDGRAELFLEKIVPELRDVMNSGDQNKIKSFIDRYEISWAFFMTGLEDDKAFQNLPGWKKIYRDDAASIYVREKP